MKSQILLQNSLNEFSGSPEILHQNTETMIKMAKNIQSVKYVQYNLPMRKNKQVFEIRSDFI